MEDKKTRIAINGLGRIGRQALKACLGVSDDVRMRLSDRIDPAQIEVVAVNDLTDARVLAHLIRYDTVYGRFQKEILVKVNGETVDWEGHTDVDDHMTELEGGDVSLVIGGAEIKVFSKKDPHELPWGDLGVDVVLESTGVFTKYEDAKAHIEAGAKKVVISAPGKGEEGVDGKTLVFGTDAVEKGSDLDVIANASCTTNCISPVIQVLESEFGVEKALMTTIHAYTASNTLVDSPSREGIRMGRGGAANLIPTKTGAAKATTLAIPDLAGKFDGISVRVPVVVGSLSDITAVLKRDVTVEELEEVFVKKAEEPMYKGVLEATREPLVSTDIIGNPASSIVDLEFLRVVGGNMVKILAWYDNEWGYSNRLVEMAVEISKS
ncbi:aldehyde dehydrogenase [candidate division WWE3 bacterium]|uniref:Aldehyde dehydrogenase n=1 Tax=candidate division WWE3 bacterium TaxID=2053526 RepID=A0A955LKB2_UNCKA|nr:aldehyde dehydrogenase [candidate division WWE3 bacterium]